MTPQLSDNSKVKLAAVKATHSFIFVVMAAATLYIFFCGLMGRTDKLFLVSLALLTVESVVFLGNGAKCPLTNLAQRLGATKGYVFDSFFPERWTRFTVPVFTSILGVGLILWVLHRIL
jgi:hypothetical protein